MTDIFLGFQVDGLTQVCLFDGFVINMRFVCVAG